MNILPMRIKIITHCIILFINFNTLRKVKYHIDTLDVTHVLTVLGYFSFQSTMEDIIC